VKRILSGTERRRTAKNHRTVRWCTGLSGEPTVGRANGRSRNPLMTRGRANGLMGAPDCPVCTGQCPVRQRLQIINGRLRENRKEICTGQCPVVHRTVRCTSRQKARFAFLDCSQRLLAAFISSLRVVFCLTSCFNKNKLDFRVKTIRSMWLLLILS
jgi:hypothetical protein